MEYINTITCTVPDILTDSTHPLNARVFEQISTVDEQVKHGTPRLGIQIFGENNSITYQANIDCLAQKLISYEDTQREPDIDRLASLVISSLVHLSRPEVTSTKNRTERRIAKWMAKSTVEALLSNFQKYERERMAEQEMKQFQETKKLDDIFVPVSSPRKGWLNVVELSGAEALYAEGQAMNNCLKRPQLTHREAASSRSRFFSFRAGANSYANAEFDVGTSSVTQFLLTNNMELAHKRYLVNTVIRSMAALREKLEKETGKEVFISGENLLIGTICYEDGNTLRINSHNFDLIEIKKKLKEQEIGKVQILSGHIPFGISEDYGLENAELMKTMAKLSRIRLSISAPCNVNFPLDIERVEPRVSFVSYISKDKNRDARLTIGGGKTFVRSAYFGFDVVKILGDITFEDKVEFYYNSVSDIEGALYVRNELIVEEDCKVNVVGNIYVGGDLILQGNIHSDGEAVVAGDCYIPKGRLLPKNFKVIGRVRTDFESSTYTS